MDLMIEFSLQDFKIFRIINFFQMEMSKIITLVGFLVLAAVPSSNRLLTNIYGICFY